MRLRLGNSFDGTHPARATMREFRSGVGTPPTYSYRTLDLNQVLPQFPEGRNVTVDCAERYFTHRYPMRGFGFPDMFIDLTTENVGFWHMCSHWPQIVPYGSDYRSWGVGEDTSDEVGLTFRLRSLAGVGPDTQTWFDNSSLLVSGILWEFNSRQGWGDWYQLYIIPTTEYTRITMPYPANRVRLRASSNDTHEWVQGIVIRPIPDYQMTGYRTHVGKPTDVRADDNGLVRWEPAPCGVGQVRYYVWALPDGSQDPVFICRTTKCYAYATTDPTYSGISAINNAMAMMSDDVATVDEPMAIADDPNYEPETETGIPDTGQWGYETEPETLWSEKFAGNAYTQTGWWGGSDPGGTAPGIGGSSDEEWKQPVGIKGKFLVFACDITDPDPDPPTADMFK